MEIAELAEAIFDGPFGSNLKSSDYTAQGTRVVRLENVGRLRFIDEKTAFISEAKGKSLSRHNLHADDVLFSSFVSENIRVCLFPGSLEAPAINKADCFCIRVDRRLCEPRFLEFRLAAPTTLQDMRRAVHGATRPRIGIGDLKRYRICVPSLAEQRRIVASIDASLNTIESARSDLRSVGALGGRLRQAILAKEFAAIAESAPYVPLEQLASHITSGSRDWSQYYGKGDAVFVLAANLRPMSFDPTPRQFVDPPRDGADVKRTLVRENDLLITIVGANTGVTCRVDVDVNDYYVCQSVALVRLREQKYARFVELFLNTEGFGRDQIVKAIYGQGRPHLSFADIKGLLVPLVDEGVVDRVVERLDESLRRSEGSIDQARRGLSLLDKLRDAVLSKAFRADPVSS